MLGALDRYDFREPHVIGGEDHADGELRRFVEGQLMRVTETPSHLVIDEPSGFLYAVDGGNARIVRLDTKSGVENGEVPTNDALQVHARMQDAELDEIVPPGTLELPSGIALAGGTLFVTDSLTSKIYAFDLDGELLRWVDTGLPAGTLAGVTVGSDDRLYLSDLRTGNAYRAVPAE
jgi:outer membrane protein assembly factor BamB